MMMSIPREAFEVIIIGGGIAGDALAAVLAGAGRVVLVLERSTVYRDQFRGELFQSWGVPEARRLGLHEVLMRASGAYHARIVPYNETVEPAEPAAVALDTIL
jgi:2-polyprenyl-6-methoxyphenol hydroxylase-like FAD-dependent oxidoreductase